MVLVVFSLYFVVLLKFCFFYLLIFQLSMTETRKKETFPREMAGEGKARSEDLNLCFEKLMMLAFGGGKSGSSEGGVKMEGAVITEWKDIPVELLLRIVSLVDDRTVIMASGVCSGWRDAICMGLTHLCLSWCKNNMNNLVLSLAPKFTKLQTLVLRQDKPQLEDHAVETIASYCHDLQDLDLSKSFKLSDLSLYALAHGCPNLTKLNISGCTAFSDAGLEFLTEFCRKLKILNLCGCVKGATDRALQGIGRNCSQLQSLNLGWCENVGDVGVMSLAFGCPDLRTLDLCGCVCITDDSVIALANRCPHLRSLGLYYCRNITDRAMYSLVHNRVKNKLSMWESMKGRCDEEGLRSLNISQCTALTPPAVQALCDSFPALHTCSGRHSLVMSGCLNLTSVHCVCAVQAHRSASSFPHPAH
ncbi:F-box protein SKP2B-like [Populus alba x Populus x berolinensis]|uniref:F-box protein SKP2B-like n=2 Tax=Populus alba x Populus x berolinensis TaxID=444605 RepID=A0AAD6QWV5_9ROSI|nr:F-box protein SKP2B-like [Populus alba x Populus x berolinensis]